MSTHPKLLWELPDWQKQAHNWIRTEVARQSIQLTGEIEQNHAYAWSTVMRVPTDQSMLFFKATASETIFEAALTQKLTEWYPDYMPELIAVDTTRGWMLMRDGGEQLRTLIRPMQDIKPWDPVIVRYSAVQVGLSEHVSEMLALGVPDCRLAALPTIYENLLGDEKSLMINQEKGLTSAETKTLQDLMPRFQQICTDLAAFGIPESLNQGDFHDGNTLLKNGRITFFDWGDANVTHPFVSLRTCFVSIEISLKLEDYSFTPEMSALLDHYLEPWQKFASMGKLLTAYPLSKPVAAIVKAFSWYQTISRLDGSLREEYAWIVPEVLREFMVYEKMLFK
ncbi:MAG TPA: phosphotransferase [Anaerolineales bacterium]|nr:phosphotransferase [Anaerolineales bacterium]